MTTTERPVVTDVLQHKPLAIKLANQFYHYNQATLTYDQEDFHQDAFEGLVRAVNFWNDRPQTRSKFRFSTVAWGYIIRALQKGLKHCAMRIAVPIRAKLTKADSDSKYYVARGAAVLDLTDPLWDNSARRTPWGEPEDDTFQADTWVAVNDLLTHWDVPEADKEEVRVTLFGGQEHERGFRKVQRAILKKFVKEFPKELTDIVA